MDAAAERKWPDRSHGKGGSPMLGFIVGLIAGFATPHLEEPVARPVARAIAHEIPIEPEELLLLAFMIALLIASVIAAAAESSNAFSVVLGGTIGYFAVRILAMVRRAIDGRPRG